MGVVLIHISPCSRHHKTQDGTSTRQSGTVRQERKDKRWRSRAPRRRSTESKAQEHRGTAQEHAPQRRSTAPSQDTPGAAQARRRGGEHPLSSREGTEEASRPQGGQHAECCKDTPLLQIWPKITDLGTTLAMQEAPKGKEAPHFPVGRRRAQEHGWTGTGARRAGRRSTAGSAGTCRRSTGMQRAQATAGPGPCGLGGTAA